MIVGKKQAPRNHTKYLVKKGNKILHGGITARPLEERAAEHGRTYPGSRVVKQGPKVTERTAREWEKEHGYS